MAFVLGRQTNACWKTASFSILFWIFRIQSQEIHTVSDSPIVEKLENGNFALREFHSDGGKIAAGRSRGKLEAAPFVSISYRYNLLNQTGLRRKVGGVHVEWRVGNCEVGAAGVHSVLTIQGLEVGSCWFPHCFTDIPLQSEEREVRVFLRNDNEGRDVDTALPSHVFIPGVAEDDDIRKTCRQQTCLVLPHTSDSGDLHITDVVFSKVLQKLVLFGPTHRPLGGLYCVWDKNPQTCQEGCAARKVCYHDRIPQPLQLSSVWARPEDGSSVLHTIGVRANEDPAIPRRIFQCIFSSDPPFTSNATLVIDNQLSHNLAFCDVPESLRLAMDQGDSIALPSVTFQAIDMETSTRLSSVMIPLCPYISSAMAAAKVHIPPSPVSSSTCNV